MLELAYRQRANNGPQNGLNVVQPERRRAQCYRHYPAFFGNRLFCQRIARRRGDHRQHYLYDREKLRLAAAVSFGKGDIRGVARRRRRQTAPLPRLQLHPDTLTLGVPGSGTTAVMMGALTAVQHHTGPGDVREQPGYRLGTHRLRC